jgi:hypothetical protein
MYMEYHYSSIKVINTRELIFIDQNHEEKHIHFTECRDNWITYVNHSHEYATNNLTRNDTVCVAWRNAFSKPRYIEFFTEPKTKFIYPPKKALYEWMRKFCSDSGYKAFRKTCIDLENNGWTTFDLG